jgi:hypothetical protein
VIALEDNIHCETQGTYQTFEEAIAELKRRALIPWDTPPNQAPCTGWRKCGREYEVIEYETSQVPWRRLRQAVVLHVSPSGNQWEDNFQKRWGDAKGD